MLLETYHRKRENISEGVKNGMVERRRQGLHCEPLPFGVMKGQNWVPVPAMETFPFLSLAFKLAVAGKSGPRSGSTRRRGLSQIPVALAV